MSLPREGTEHDIARGLGGIRGKLTGLDKPVVADIKRVIFEQSLGTTAEEGSPGTASARASRSGPGRLREPEGEQLWITSKVPLTK